jgi:hypothetical protein
MRRKTFSNFIHPIEKLETRRLMSTNIYPTGTPNITETASATVALQSTTGSGANTVFTYDVTLNNTGNVSLGTFWFGWTPGEDFMKSMPTNIASPSGWTDSVTNLGSSDGFAIQWVANGTSLAAGQSLSGFVFSSADSPTDLGGNSVVHPGTPVETSVVYMGAPLTDSGDQFVAAAPTVPTGPTAPTATETASATLALQSTTGKGANTIYNYDLTLTNTGPTSIGTFWFSWIPDEDFLRTMPTSVSDPTGWSNTITHETASKDGFAIRWVAGTTASPDASVNVPVGGSLSGFEFSSKDSPAALAGRSKFFPKMKVETSFVYSGAPFSDTGFQFNVAKPTVPAGGSLLAKLPTTPTITASTIPTNGDVNPYGVAIVPNNFVKGGTISPGDVLVSNFNDSDGLQGTGTTIVSISPTGAQTTFFQGETGLGLTTALGILHNGFVLVGNVPAPDGANVQGPGSLLVLDKNGAVVDTLSDPNLLDGPWDLTVQDGGKTANVFVSNVLNGTVTRIKLSVSTKTDSVSVLSETQIASGYAFRTDPAALVVGPTGLALSGSTLFVASTGDNAIFAIRNAISRKTSAGTGKLIFQNGALRGPLALAFDGPNLVAANGDAVNPDPTGEQNSELIEFTPNGKFSDMFQIDTTIGGAFGLAFAKIHGKRVFAAIDDVTNTLEEWVLR